MDTSHAPECFRSLLLRHRGRTRLIQRGRAARAGFSLRSLQDWEASVTFPTAERLQALIRVLLDAGDLKSGQVTSEVPELRTAAEGEAPRMHAHAPRTCSRRPRPVRRSLSSRGRRGTPHPTIPER